MFSCPHLQHSEFRRHKPKCSQHHHFWIFHKLLLTHIHTHTHTYTHTYIHTYTHTHTYIHTYIHTYTHTYIFTYLLTYSMVHSPSWEANWFAANQEIPRILWNSKVHCLIQKCPPNVCILNELDPVHARTSHLIKNHLNIILPSTPRSP